MSGYLIMIEADEEDRQRPVYCCGLEQQQSKRSGQPLSTRKVGWPRRFRALQDSIPGSFPFRVFAVRKSEM